jgi:hypothetical protein
MSDLLEHDLREALADRAARMNPEASARLRAVDYRRSSRWLPTRPVLGSVGLSAAAAAAAAAILLGSSPAPAFAGWTANPTAPLPDQVAAAEQRCGAGAGTPVLIDTRGPYTASIYADGSTCVEGNGITISGSSGGGKSSLPAGAIQLNGAGESDSDGHALTMVDGPIGAGVTSVTITRGDGSSVQATVKNGWYLAWWPGTQRAVTAQVASESGTSTRSFPTAPDQPSPACPAGAHCASGYGFGSAPVPKHRSSFRWCSTSTSAVASFTAGTRWRRHSRRALPARSPAAASA